MTAADRQATESSPTPAEPRATVSPLPLATDLRSADERDLPSRTDVLAAALSDTIGGPVGRHALIGRTRILTPLRVMFAIALVFLALGWTTKSPCLQTVGTGTADQKVANWSQQRAYFELCYSDTVPLYGAELLSQGKFPYKSSWLEMDNGKPRQQYDGTPAVMEPEKNAGLRWFPTEALPENISTAVEVMLRPCLRGQPYSEVIHDLPVTSI